MGEYPRLQQYLFGGASFPLDDCLCCLVVLVRHGAGKGGHSLTVTDVEANVWVGNEELYDDAVLVADGNVDGCSAFRILAEDKGKKRFKKNTFGADYSPQEESKGISSFCTASRTAENGNRLPDSKEPGLEHQ